MQLQNFDFNKKDIRILVDEKNEMWFVATDVAKVLGYRDALNMTRNLDPEDSATHNLSIRSNNGIDQNRKVTIINESGLYTAIFHSRRPEAKQFKRWVTSEVLPSIRKHGMYATEDKTDEMLNDPDAMKRTLEKLEQERKRADEAEEKIFEDFPKVLRYERFMGTDRLFPVKELAKVLNLGPKKLTRYMRKKDILEKRTDCVMPKEPYNSNGYFELKYFTLNNGEFKPHARLTAKGLDYFIKKFDGLQL